MPPIKSSDRLAKHFLSPSQFNSSKRIPAFPFQQTPKRDTSGQRLDALHSPFNALSEKNNDSTAKMNIEKMRGLPNTFKPKATLKAPGKLPAKNGEYEDSESRSDSKERQDEASRKAQANDPMTTFQTFMSRLNKLQINSVLPNYEPIRFSDKAHGLVRGFAVCTNQGLVRNYNEDRVSVVLNIAKPANKAPNDYWPNCSMFGVFDGHGGSKCAEFLRNSLHQYIINNKNFPWNPQEAIKEAFEEADKDFIENVLIESEEGKYDRSGSCAILMILVDDTCYICNVGDSRAVSSQNYGNIARALSRDHKPSDKLEQKRILDAGGKVYQNFPMGPNGKRIDMDPKNNPLNLQVPFRILPGRLSVSRAFGDIEAKMARFGGNPNVLISKPEITTLKITKEHDFIFLASDGVYDKMENEDITSAAWNLWSGKRDQNVHSALKTGVEHLIKETLLRKSLDNVTGILVGFSHLESFFEDGTRKEASANTRAEYFEELKYDNTKEGIENQLPSPLQRINHGLSSPVVSYNELKTPSRGMGYSSKPTNDGFDLSKYMDPNVRRSSDGLPKITQIKPTKGL